MALSLLKRGGDDSFPDDGMDDDPSKDGFGWGWVFLEHILGVFDGNLSPGKDSKEKQEETQTRATVTPTMPPPAPRAPATRGSNPSSPQTARVESPEARTYDMQIKSAAAQLRPTSQAGESKSGGSTPVLSSAVPRVELNRVSLDPQSSTLSEGSLISPESAHGTRKDEPFSQSSSATNSPAAHRKHIEGPDLQMSSERRRSGSLMNGGAAHHITTSTSSTTPSGISSPVTVARSGVPPKDCLIHTALQLLGQRH